MPRQPKLSSSFYEKKTPLPVVYITLVLLSEQDLKLSLTVYITH